MAGREQSDDAGIKPVRFVEPQFDQLGAVARKARIKEPSRRRREQGLLVAADMVGVAMRDERESLR